MWTRHQMLHQTDGTHHETLVTQDEDVGLKIEESDSVWIEEELGSCFVYPRLTWDDGSDTRGPAPGVGVSSAPASASRSHHLGLQSSPAQERGNCDNIVRARMWSFYCCEIIFFWMIHNTLI